MELNGNCLVLFSVIKCVLYKVLYKIYIFIICLFVCFMYIFVVVWICVFGDVIKGYVADILRKEILCIIFVIFLLTL